MGEVAAAVTGSIQVGADRSHRSLRCHGFLAILCLQNKSNQVAAVQIIELWTQRVTQKIYWHAVNECDRYAASKQIAKKLFEKGICRYIHVYLGSVAFGGV